VAFGAIPPALKPAHCNIFSLYFTNIPIVECAHLATIAAKAVQDVGPLLALLLPPPPPPQLPVLLQAPLHHPVQVTAWAPLQAAQVLVALAQPPVVSPARVPEAPVQVLVVQLLAPPVVPPTSTSSSSSSSSISSSTGSCLSTDQCRREGPFLIASRETGSISIAV
jgi:hypothetical protein